MNLVYEQKSAIIKGLLSLDNDVIVHLWNEADFTPEIYENGADFLNNTFESPFDLAHLLLNKNQPKTYDVNDDYVVFKTPYMLESFNNPLSYVGSIGQFKLIDYLVRTEWIIDEDFVEGIKNAFVRYVSEKHVYTNGFIYDLLDENAVCDSDILYKNWDELAVEVLGYNNPDNQ